MAQVVRLATRQRAASKARLKQAAQVLQAIPPEDLQLLSETPALTISRVVHALLRAARDPYEVLWAGGFVMLSRDQTEFVWDRIRELPGRDRPILVRDAFIMMMLNIRQDTGEVMLTRGEMAAKLGVHPDRVSTVMSTLERMHVIKRDLTRVDGMKGRGVVTYVVNANVGWNGNSDIRKVEAATMPLPSSRGVVVPISKGKRAKPSAVT